MAGAAKKLDGVSRYGLQHSRATGRSTPKREDRWRLMEQIAQRAEGGEQLKSIALDLNLPHNTVSIWMRVMGYKRVWRKVE